MAESLKKFIIGTVVPLVVGGVMTWLTSTKVLALFNIDPASAASEITSVLVFVTSTAVTWLHSHFHIL